MTYKDLTILKFQQVKNAILECQGNEIREAMNILSILYDRPIEDYVNMKFKDFQKECTKLDWFTNDFKNLPDKWFEKFECEGETFEIVKNVTDWTAEQFISMSNLTKSDSDVIDNLHLILATLTKGSESLTELKRRSELFQNHLSIEIAHPTAFFFAGLMVLLSQTSLYSSMLKEKRKKPAKMIGLFKSGIGITQ